MTEPRDRRIAAFFKDPNIERTIEDLVSTLYLLRQEINQCLTVNQRADLDNKILWLVAMGILAGIDLLAKLLAGNDNGREVGRRFVAFVERYFDPISPDDAQAIYQFRNSLLHSFGLYSERTRPKQVYKFATIAKPHILTLVQRDLKYPDQYFINLPTLHSRFEEAIVL